MNSLIIAATLILGVGAGVHAQQPAKAASSAPRSNAVSTLLDNEGVPLLPDPGAIPANPEHRVRSGLYATEAQARSHERTLPGRVISVRVDCCSEQGIENAVRDAWYQYVIYDAPKDMPVLVRGQDLRLAARVADRLGGAGFAPVFLVTVP